MGCERTDSPIPGSLQGEAVRSREHQILDGVRRKQIREEAEHELAHPGCSCHSQSLIGLSLKAGLDLIWSAENEWVVP